MKKKKKSTDFWVASSGDMTGLIPAGPVDEQELDLYEELYPLQVPEDVVKSASESQKQPFE